MRISIIEYLFWGVTSILGAYDSDYFIQNPASEEEWKVRTVEDMNSRLNSVDKMVEIVENTFYYQDFYTGREKSKIIYYWTILGVVNDIRYGVIIRKKGKQGNKHIYSIIPNFRGVIPRSDRDKIN